MRTPSCIGRDAIAYSIILRDKRNETYRSVVADMDLIGRSGDLIQQIGGTGPFDKGLYGSSEMFVNGFLELYKQGILRRKVYGDVTLQRLLNDGTITEQVTPAMLEALVIHQAVRPRLGEADLAYLQKFGVFRSDVRLVGDVLHTADGRKIEANLADDAALKQITAHCLGSTLKGGILMHAGFFLGPMSFYNELNSMSEEQMFSVNQGEKSASIKVRTMAGAAGWRA